MRSPYARQPRLSFRFLIQGRHETQGHFDRTISALHNAALDDTGWPHAFTLIDEAVGTIGTPDQVARKMDRFKNEFQCTHFIMSTQLAGMDPKKSTRSLELFAKEIMPSFRE